MSIGLLEVGVLSVLFGMGLATAGAVAYVLLRRRRK